ncbi:MAG: hypothetical protein J3Q66DRAFT_393886 [Benniella sp.]|nr:MAG: hypothetical protein J3Q66DRAFT_393886 [Benniella sp.]
MFDVTVPTCLNQSGYGPEPIANSSRVVSEQLIPENSVSGFIFDFVYVPLIPQLADLGPHPCWAEDTSVSGVIMPTNIEYLKSPHRANKSSLVTSVQTTASTPPPPSTNRTCSRRVVAQKITFIDMKYLMHPLYLATVRCKYIQHIVMGLYKG